MITSGHSHRNVVMEVSGNHKDWAYVLAKEDHVDTDFMEPENLVIVTSSGGPLPKYLPGAPYVCACDNSAGRPNKYMTGYYIEKHRLSKNKLYRYEKGIRLPFLTGEKSSVRRDCLKAYIEDGKCPDCGMDAKDMVKKPDRPIVTGAVYNGRNMPPYSLPAEKTKSAIRTESTPGGGGFNEIRFEDKKGEEEIYIHGEKDWNIEILNDKGQTVGHDEKLDVANDRGKSVGNDQKESVGNNKDITVAKTHTEDIGEDMRVTVARNKSQKVGENKSVEIGKNLDERVGENVTVRIGNTESVEIGKDYSMSIGNNASVDVKTDASGRVGDNTVISSGKHLSADAGETMNLTAGKTMTISSDGSDVVIKTGGATVTLAKNGDITLDGANTNINASGNINMKGSAINQN